MEQAASSAKDPTKVKALEEQIDTLRAEASANVAELGGTCSGGPSLTLRVLLVPCQMLCHP